jgi:hypothetical protein
MARVLKVVERVVLVHCSDTGNKTAELANTFSSISIDSTSQTFSAVWHQIWGAMISVTSSSTVSPLLGLSEPRCSAGALMLVRL